VSVFVSLSVCLSVSVYAMYMWECNLLLRIHLNVSCLLVFKGTSKKKRWMNEKILKLWMNEKNKRIESKKCEIWMCVYVRMLNVSKLNSEQ